MRRLALQKIQQASKQTDLAADRYSMVFMHFSDNVA